MFYALGSVDFSHKARLYGGANYGNPVSDVEQVGEERMLYLLSYASIFVPLPNFCLLQVAGHPYSMSASRMKQIFQPVTTARRNQCELRTVPQQQALRMEQKTSLETNEVTSYSMS